MKTALRTLDKLSPRDRRAVLVGLAATVLILVYSLALAPWFDRWSHTRSEIASIRAQLRIFDNSPAVRSKREALVAAVPVFELPDNEENQAAVFRGRVNEQLKKAGVQIKSLSFQSRTREAPAAGYKTLLLECRGQCRLEQIFDLLADLDENPYLVGVEKMNIRCDSNNRNQMEVDLTMSTWCR